MSEAWEQELKKCCYIDSEGLKLSYDEAAAFIRIETRKAKVQELEEVLFATNGIHGPSSEFLREVLVSRMKIWK